MGLNIDAFFVFEKETKNMVRFQEVEKSAKIAGTILEIPVDRVIGTLYVSKSVFKGKAPEKLMVTLHMDAE